MKKILFLILSCIIISNCTLNKVVKTHGVQFLEVKQNQLDLNTTNKNDVLKLLGPPSTKSTFDNDLWIYIERRTSKSSVFKLGKSKMLANNVLLLEINNRGLLVKKDFFDINNMESLEFSKETTKLGYSKKSFVYDFLSSMRQKLNDPLNKRKKK
tara:strand:+ start:290 stop:754 length:465 start_codon:yes stop_codon:yes gene_type:complete